MSKVLSLYNTFTRTLNPVQLGGRLVAADQSGRLTHGSLYICGPTVYSDSHVGHAITYIRADLFRRFMKSLFNVRLTTVMNITDIDDKILLRTGLETEPSTKCNLTDPSSHLFNVISERYFKSFKDDMNSIRVLPPDLYVKVSKHVHLITAFIRQLERNGNVYFATNGDVRFRVASIPAYKGRIDGRKKPDVTKDDPRDFVLWKVAKPHEPVWIYQSSTTDKSVPGRPGWHVQCSAISTALFGNHLDFHYGGKDLIFPHHYNEEACCCAYHKLDTSESLHVWAKNWLHSGHLVVKDAKMSKSLANVVAIKSFIDRTSVNALRLLCVFSHYRSNLDYDDELLDRIKAMDHKINAFGSYLIEALRRSQQNLRIPDEQDEHCSSTNLEQEILSTHCDIIEGVCDDFQLGKGLESILNLAKLITSTDVNNISPHDLVASLSLLMEWCADCGLEYAYTTNSASQDGSLLELISEFRQSVRGLTLGELKRRKASSPDKESSAVLQELLKECDTVRARLDHLGFVLRDSKDTKGLL